MSDKKINLVLCWHMHQPWYRESLDGDYRLPWVYLHALKDYSDMAAHFEAHPHMRSVVNFTPVLLEQLDDYSRQCDAWLQQGANFTEPMLNQLAGNTPIPADPEQRETLIQACLRAHAPQMIHPYPAYHQLVYSVSDDDGKHIKHHLMGYLNDQFFLDLLTWYHITWLGHSMKQRSDVQALMEKGHNFSVDDRRRLIGIMGETFGGLINRYRALSERGQIELSMTPYAHPIVPLLIDMKSMHDALPEAPLPSHHAYPGGMERARWHMAHGLEVFEHYFGRRPNGVWLSEGSVSDESIKLLEEFDMAWSASGEGVWHNSCYMAGMDVHAPEARRSLFQCHQLPDIEPRLFFRDDGLSDLIGFEYQQWDASDAARDFVKHLGNITEYLGDSSEEHVISVILDGENAWEYYPDNAYHFLNALYAELEHADNVHLTTFNDAVCECPHHVLPKLCAGSWVYGSFSTWIGEVDKNRAWDLLVEAKLAYDEAMAGDQLGEEQRRTAGLQLAICEGSDWFWWFGDYNPGDSVRDFDELYRQQLKNLYTLLQREVPDILDISLSSGGGDAANAGTMRRGHEN